MNELKRAMRVAEEAVIIAERERAALQGTQEALEIIALGSEPVARKIALAALVRVIEGQLEPVPTLRVVS